jgi:hypothetical protein
MAITTFECLGQLWSVASGFAARLARQGIDLRSSLPSFNWHPAAVARTAEIDARVNLWIEEPV